MKPLVLVAALVAGCSGSPDVALPYGTRAEDCGSCHADHFAEWMLSSHARSSESPVRAALMPEVERAWGAFARSRCDGCHAPGHGGDAGIGCTTCHAAIGNHAERDGELAVDLEEPIAGPLADPEATPAHATRPGDFLASPSLCGTCHEVTGPGLFVEPTLSEWRASPQAAIGQRCLDCHMPAAIERPLTADGTGARPVRSHRFVGFDPIWGDATAEEAAAAAEQTRALLASALSLEATFVEGGVEVVVTNVGAGHSVPTGATFLRDLWVDLERDGTTVASRVLWIGDQPMHDGAPVALPTDADSIEHHALAPGAEARTTLDVDATEAVLRGSAVKREVLFALDLDEIADRVPTHEIARVPVAP